MIKVMIEKPKSTLSIPNKRQGTAFNFELKKNSAKDANYWYEF